MKKIIFFIFFWLVFLKADELLIDGIKAYGDREFFLATKLFEQSCKNDNNIAGCNNYAVMLSIGQGVKIDIKKAAELFAKSCELNNAEGCLNLASILINYSANEVNNFSQIISFYEKSCMLGSRDGCYNLAVIYTNGIGTKIDLDKALANYKKACDNNHAQACSNAGVLARKHNNILQAKEYFFNACEQNNMFGCYNLGVTMAKEAQNDIEAYSAQAYLDKSCQLGEYLACEASKKLQKNINNKLE